MSPTRVVGLSGTYVITLYNQGNADVTQSFEASDPEEWLSYKFKPEEVVVPAGGSTTVELFAEPKMKPKVKGGKEYPFQAVVKPSEADKFSPEAKTLNGQLVYERKAAPKPRRRWWLIGLIVAVVAIIIAILLIRACYTPSPPQKVPREVTPSAYIDSITPREATEGQAVTFVGRGTANGDSVVDSKSSLMGKASAKLVWG